MLFIILSRVVTVLCPGLQACWGAGKRLLALRYAGSWERTNFQWLLTNRRKEKKKKRRRKIGDGPVVFQIILHFLFFYFFVVCFEKWFYNGRLKNRGQGTSLHRLIDDGCHCRKQLLQPFSKEGRGKWVKWTGVFDTGSKKCREDSVYESSVGKIGSCI